MQTGFRAIRIAAGAESLSTTFRVLVGDAELAKKTLMDLEEFALATPFEMPELVGAAKQMIAYGTEAENIVPTMRMLGDVSSGLSIPLSALTYLYGTLKAQGRAMTIDIRQFAMRGIPIYLELAKVMGLVGKGVKKVPEDVRLALNELIKEGAVNFAQVEQAFKNMTSAGGTFFNLMDERSKTLEGLFNEMRESIDLSLREIGNTLIEGLQLHKVTQQITALAGHVSTLLKGMSAETRRAIIIGMGLVGVFVLIKAAIFAAGIMLTLFTGGINIWIGLATAAIGLAGVWVYKMGGLQKAWKIVKRAAMDFWNFIKPILPLIGTLIAGITLYFAPWIAVIALVVYYWRDVLQAVKDVYNFLKPTLRALWSLIKTVGFAVRDNLVIIWDQVVSSVKKVISKVSELWSSITGGEAIDWSEIKDGLRDLVLFVEYAFINMASVSNLAWDMIKYAAFVAADEMTKHLWLVPVAIVGGFIALAKAVKDIFKSMLESLANSVDAAIDAIWEAIKGGDIKAAVAGIQKAFDNMVIDGAKVVTEFEKEVRRRVGKVEFHKIEVDGIQIPVGLEVEGLRKARTDAFNAVQLGMKVANEGFAKFKADKLLQFQFEDAADIFLEAWESIVLPFMFPLGAVGDLGTQAGATFNEAFDKEFKKVEAVLFSSAEALSRMTEYRERLPNVVRRTDIKQMVMAQQPPTQPNKAELETVGWLSRIFSELEKQTKQPPIQIIPADLP